jgi:lipoate---protein ligase
MMNSEDFPNCKTARLHDFLLHKFNYLYFMLCLISINREIYFNLALEEYLLMHEVQDYFILWQCRPSVVSGKHQNTLAEINNRFVKENDIQVARRLSGGGTVYHDEGNLNFTFIANGETGRLVDFKRFITPVVDFLETLGLKAEQGEKNEILIGGKKISGNAEHVYKNRVLHHATLLFHSNLSLLRESLKVVPGRYKDKAVQSNRSSVINISECLNDSMKMASFERAFLDFMLTRSGGKQVELSRDQIAAIEDLAINKYRTWDWVYGWSPDYELRNTFLFQDLECRIFLSAHRGILKDCRLESQQIPEPYLHTLMNLMTDCRHEREQIRKRINTWSYPGISEEKAIEEFVSSFF